MSDITPTRIEQALMASASELAEELNRSFAKFQLADEENPDSVAEHMETIYRKLTLESQLKLQNGSEHNGSEHLGSLATACLSAGIVNIVSVLAAHSFDSSSPCQAKIYLASRSGFLILKHLLRNADPTVQVAIFEQVLSHNIISILLRHLNHSLHLFRCIAVDLLDTLITISVYTKIDISAIVSTMITALCRFALQSPDTFERQCQSSTLDWRTVGIGPFSDTIYSPDIIWGASEFWARSQECAMRAVSNQVCSSSLNNSKFCLEILKEKPEVLDLLFDCTILSRSTSYPQSRINSSAYEVIALFLRWPSYVVPGVPTLGDPTLDTQYWKVLMQCMRIMTSRKDWADKIMESWMRIEEEGYDQISTMLDGIRSTCYPQQRSKGQILEDIFSERGALRITIMRIISTLSYAAEPCGITNAEIESFLYLAYSASRMIKPRAECHNNKEFLSHIERSRWICKCPEYPSNMDPDFLLNIAQESVIGPTALTRLLIVLARRKTLDGIQRLNKAPAGLSSATSLHHVQQITHPDVIRRFLTIALQRVKECLDKGQCHMNTEQYTDAQAAFMAAAELAAALLEFDTHTRGQYNDKVKIMRRDVLSALSDASDMALRRSCHQQALAFALGANTIAENIPNEGLDTKIREKIKCRIQRIRKVMSSK